MHNVIPMVETHVFEVLEEIILFCPCSLSREIIQEAMPLILSNGKKRAKIFPTNILIETNGPGVACMAGAEVITPSKKSGCPVAVSKVMAPPIECPNIKR